jgi:DNA mismatch repair ATPase MutS
VEGKSHYLAEIESVLALVHAKGDGRQNLFLLDELFRGTNTTERIAAGYAAHHFREQVTDDTLSFDFLLQSGPSSTRNAIALLKLMHYPEDVVPDALAAIDWQRGHRSGESS